MKNMTETPYTRTQKTVSWQAVVFILAILNLLFCFFVFLQRASLNPQEVQESSPLRSMAFGISFSFLAFATVRYRIFRRRKKTIAAQALMKDRGGEKPVLYLRSFRADAAASTVVNETTEEEQLAQALNPLGPFVAIGRPGEELPELGASRMYVKQNQWKETVMDLMKNSRVVVMRIGDSKGFWWEFQQALQSIRPEQLLLLVPEDEELYRRFCEKAKEYLPCSLPEYRNDRDYLAIFIEVATRLVKLLPPPEFLTGYTLAPGHMGTLRGVIYFEPDTTARGVLFGLNFFRGTYSAPGVPILNKALQPFFKQLNADIKVPRIKLIKFLAPLLALLLIGFSFFEVFQPFIYLNDFFVAIRD